MTPDLWQIENVYPEYNYICGTDEAGRGPLAGPVCAAAVILPHGLIIPGLNDSKKLTDKRRRALFEQITQQAISFSICFVGPKEIDELNILQASLLAMKHAIESLPVPADFALVDGNHLPHLSIPARDIIGGDGKSANIAAASILAKVTRDRFMEAYAAEYPGYGFEIHKGYPTKRHYQALFELGPSPIHRQSFLTNLEKKREAVTYD